MSATWCLRRDDLRRLADSEEPFDQALAIDVLEHIDNHAEAVRQLAHTLSPGGRLVVSVPTPRYPVVFGRRFHESIGHVRDGYLAEDLKTLLERGGFVVKSHHYYTRGFASWWCSLYYRRGLSPAAATLLLPFAVPLALLGERLHWGPPASLAMVAVRV